jgi:magnesium transporter
MPKKRGTRKRKITPGAAPGTITVDPNATRPECRVIAYEASRYVEHKISRPDEIPAYLEQWPVVWVDVKGLGDAETLRDLGELFGLHGLALEDAVHQGQRAKVEIFDEHLFIILRMHPPETEGSQQISLVLTDRAVVTFQEGPGDCFELVRQRIRDGKGQIRRGSPDYLAYALIDAVIDSYFEVLERIGDRPDRLEEAIISSPEDTAAARIQNIKADLRELRRILWPHRDVVNMLLRNDTPFITDKTRVYLRDCADHVILASEQLETYGDASGDLMGAYLSSLSNRTNDVMKVLTIVAAIFIPLSFIAGLYGMNFDAGRSPWNMPELGWYWGYPAVLGLMTAVAIGMLAYFARRGWFK